MKRNFGFTPHEGGGKYGFISYKSEDEKLVAPYAKALHDKGVKLWYDYGIPPGEDWFQTISQYIVESSFVILFITERVFRSSVIHIEIQTAEMWDIPVIPVFLEDIDRNNIPKKSAAFFAKIYHKQGVDRAWSMSVKKAADSIYELISPMIASDTEERIQQRGKLQKQQSFLTQNINDSPMVQSALSEVKKEETLTDKNVNTYQHDSESHKHAQNKTPTSRTGQTISPQKSTVVVDPKQKKLFKDEEKHKQTKILKGKYYFHERKRKFLSVKTIMLCFVLLFFILMFLTLFPKYFRLYDSPDDYSWLLYNDHVEITGLINTELTVLKIPMEIEGTPVTTINSYAFYTCDNITKVIIPNSVVTIEESSFSSCSNLNEVYIPDSVSRIDEQAFRNCEKLTSVYIDGKNIYLSDDAFFHCPNLIIYGKSGSYIERYANKNNITFVAQ